MAPIIAGKKLYASQKKPHVNIIQLPLAAAYDTMADMKNDSNMYNAREQLVCGEFDKGKAESDTAHKIPVLALEDDVIGMPGQSFCVLSFIDKRDYTGVTEDSRTSQEAQNLIKFRGVFPTHERAAARVKELMLVDPYFDVQIVACGKWTTIGAGKGEDVEYENEGVQAVMQGYFDQHYTDLDAMRGRISKAKADGLPGLHADNPKDFYDAAQQLGDGVAKLALPENALEVGAAEAADMLQISSA
jgi:hypothetical protein